LKTLLLSALKLARNIAHPESLLLCYGKLGAACWHAREFPLAIRYYKKAIDILEQSLSDLIEQNWLLYHDLGLSYNGCGEYRNALTYFNRALGIALEADDDHKAGRTLIAIGLACRMLGDYIQAVDALIRSLRIWENLDDLRGQAATYNNLGLLYSDLWDWEKAFDAFHKSREAARTCGNKVLELQATCNLGACCTELGMTSLSLEYLEAALPLSRELKQWTEEAAILMNIGTIHLRHDDVERALSCSMEALQRTEEFNIPAQRSHILRSICNIYIRSSDPDNGILYGLRGLEVASEHGFRHDEHYICFLLAQAYEQVGDLPTAVAYYKRYLALEHELRNQRIRRTVVTAEMRAAIEKIEQERNRLRAKTEGLEEEVERKSKELISLSLRLTHKEKVEHEIRKQVASSGKRADNRRDETLDSLFRQLKEHDAPEAGWNIFERQFQELSHDFIHVLSSKYPALTSMELKVCSLIRAGMSSKAIADILAISLNTVNTHRYNIRTKMSLAKTENLATFMISLE
jgi:tetratricopeptide (TPR) repeat protein/DNA-binding CsgD family transcriptional regulator